MLKRLIAILAVVAATSCGGSSPSNPAPTTVQVAGVWSYTETYTGVSGGECIGAALQPLVGSTARGTVQIQQSGSSLTAIVTDGASGASCSYTGTAGATSLALNTNSCTASNLLNVRCANGSVRNVLLQTGAIAASTSGTIASGTDAETYNVTTTTGQAVAIMTIQATFSATKQ